MQADLIGITTAEAAASSALPLFESISWKQVVQAGPVPKALPVVRVVAQEAKTESTVRVVRLAYSICHSLPEIWTYYKKVVGVENISNDLQVYLDNTTNFAKQLKELEKSDWVPFVNSFADVVFTIVNDLENKILDTMQVVVQNTVMSWEMLETHVRPWVYSWYLTMVGMTKEVDDSSLRAKEYITRLSMLFGQQCNETALLLKKETVDLKQTQVYKAMNFFDGAPIDQLEIDTNALVSQLQWVSGLFGIVPRAAHAWFSVFYACISELSTQWFSNELVQSMYATKQFFGDPLKHFVNVIELGQKLHDQQKASNVVQVVNQYVEFITKHEQSYLEQNLDNVIQDYIDAGKLLNQDIEDFDWDTFNNVVNRKTGMDVKTLVQLQHDLDVLVLDAVWDNFIKQEFPNAPVIGPKMISGGDDKGKEEEEEEQEPLTADQKAEKRDLEIIASKSREQIDLRIRQVANALKNAQLRHARRQNYMENPEGRAQLGYVVRQRMIENTSVSQDSDLSAISEVDIDELVSEGLLNSFAREKIEWYQMRLRRLKRARDLRIAYQSTVKYLLFFIILVLFGGWLFYYFFQSDAMVPETDALRQILLDSKGNTTLLSEKFQDVELRRVTPFEEAARLLWPTNSTLGIYTRLLQENQQRILREEAAQAGVLSAIGSLLRDVASRAGESAVKVFDAVNTLSLAVLPDYRESYNLETFGQNTWVYGIALRVYNIRDLGIAVAGVSVLHNTFMPMIAMTIDPLFDDRRRLDSRYRSVITMTTAVGNIMWRNGQLAGRALGVYLLAEVIRQSLRVFSITVSLAVVGGTTGGGFLLIGKTSPLIVRMTQSVYQAMLGRRERTQRELEEIQEEEFENNLLALDQSQVFNYAQRLSSVLRLTSSEPIPDPITSTPASFQEQVNTLRVTMGEENISVEEARDAVRTIRQETTGEIPVTREQALLALTGAETEEQEEEEFYQGVSYADLLNEKEDSDEEEEFARAYDMLD